MLRLMDVMRVAAALVLGSLLAGCAGSTAADDLAAVPGASAAPVGSAFPQPSTRTGPLGDGRAMASCVETYSAATIANRAFAFDGTVIAIGPGGTDQPGSGGLDAVAVTFQVNEWFKGGTGDTVTVDLMPPGSSAGAAPAAYEEGTRLLVSGEPRWGGEPLDDAVAWTCGGFTRYYEAAVADEWRRGTA